MFGQVEISAESLTAARASLRRAQVTSSLLPPPGPFAASHRVADGLLAAGCVCRMVAMRGRCGRSCKHSRCSADDSC